MTKRLGVTTQPLLTIYERWFAMASDSIPLKQCSRKEQCVHPETKGGWLPATREYFHYRKASKDGFTPVCIECNKAKTSKWYKENPDKVKVYREEHQSDIAEYQKKYMAIYYEKNANVFRLKSHEWSKVNPERKKFADREYHKRIYDVESKREAVRAWRKANPEKHRAQLSKRRTRRMNAEGEYSGDDILSLYDEQQGLCAYCGIRLFDEYHIDHVVPLARGGTNWPDNLLLACPTCNSSKGDKLLPEWERLRGW